MSSNDVGCRGVALVKDKARKDRKRDASRASRSNIFKAGDRASRLALMEKQGGSLFQLKGSKGDSRVQSTSEESEVGVSSTGVKDNTFLGYIGGNENMTRKQSILADFIADEIPTLSRTSSIVAEEAPMRRRESRLLEGLIAKQSVASMETSDNSSAVMRSVTLVEREIIANKDAWTKGFKRRTITKKETEAMAMETAQEAQTSTIKIVRTLRTFYILPDTLPLTIWECLVVILVLYNAFAIPYRIAFDRNNEIETLSALDAISDVIFWADLFLQFLIAFRDPWGRIITDRHKIASNYLRAGSW